MAAPGDEKTVRFPNPDVRRIEDRNDVGDIWEAARAAGVKPSTIRAWIYRRKIEPLDLGDGPDLFHLPTVIQAGKVPRGRPPKPPLPSHRAAA